MTGSWFGKITDAPMIVAPSLGYVRLTKSKRLGAGDEALGRDRSPAAARADSERAKLLERELPFDVARLIDRRVNQNRPGPRKQHARNYAKSADAHCADGKPDVLVRYEVEKTRELDRCVCARRNLENVRAVRFGGAGFRQQNANRGRRLEVVIGNDALHFSLFGQAQQRAQSNCRAQFNINILRVG